MGVKLKMCASNLLIGFQSHTWTPASNKSIHYKNTPPQSFFKSLNTPNTPERAAKPMIHTHTYTQLCTKA